MNTTDVIDRHIARHQSPPIIIKWRNIKLQLSSGKSNWKSIQDARKALIIHIKKTGAFFDIKGTLGLPMAYHQNEIVDFIDEQIRNKDIVFLEE